MTDFSLASKTMWRMPRWAWIALGALPVLVFLWNSLYYTPWTVDDAFISLRYAQNLVDGNGLVYNPGERVEGFSNFSWVLLGALLIRLGLPFLTVLKGFGLAAGVATLLLAGALARRIGGAADGRFTAIVVLWFLGLNTSLAVWCQSGLETTWFAALIAAMVLRYEIEIESQRNLPVSAVLFALAWMTRPEAPLYAVYFLARRVSIGHRPDRNDVRWAAVFAVLVVPYEVWGFAYYGHMLTQTFGAKTVGWALSHLVDFWMFFLAQGWGFPVLFVLAAVGTLLRRRMLSPPLWGPILAGLFFIACTRTDWMPRYRFFMPILAMLGCFVAQGIADLLRTARSRPWVFFLVAATTLLAGVGYAREQLTAPFRFGSEIALPRTARPWSWWREVPEKMQERQWRREKLAWAILAYTQPGDLIVIDRIGFTGFLSMNRVWDQRGLVTPIAQEFEFRVTDPATRERLIGEFLRAGPPTHIFLSKNAGPKMANLQKMLETDPRMIETYRLIDPDRPSDSSQPGSESRFVLGAVPTPFLTWRLRELPDPTWFELGRNLERRMPAVMARFPEYRPRAAKLLKRRLSRLGKIPGGLPPGTIPESTPSQEEDR